MKQISEEYRTGVQLLDEEHAVLLELTEQVEQLFKDENMLFKCADIRKLLGKLLDYCTGHFADEEEYLEKIGYAELDKQKAAHAQFEAKLKEFMDRVSQLSLGTQDDMILELFQYLQNWLQVHIKQEDMKYSVK